MSTKNEDSSEHRKGVPDDDAPELTDEVLEKASGGNKQEPVLRYSLRSYSFPKVEIDVVSDVVPKPDIQDVDSTAKFRKSD